MDFFPWSRALAGLTLCLFLGGGWSPLWAQQDNRGHTLLSQVASSLVAISTTGPEGTKPVQGSGVVVRPQQVITSCALVPQGGTIEVQAGGQRLAASLLQADQDKELCLLAVPDLVAMPVSRGRSGSLVQQGTVWGVGGTGASSAVESGIITQLRGSSNPLIETTLLATESMLGRGLFDRSGQLVGITTLFQLGGQQLYFAAPVEWLNLLSGEQRQDPLNRHIYWLKRVVLAENATNWPQVQQLCRAWSAELPHDATAWHSLGYACINLEQPQEALQAFNETVRIDPQDLDGWSNIGFAQSELRHFSAAAQAYERVVKLRPEDVEGWLTLSLAYAAASEHDRALQAVERLEQLDPLKAQEVRGYLSGGH